MNALRAKTQEYVTRFSLWDRVQHGLMMVTFVVLLLTGLPQKWPYADASVWLIDHMGGIYTVRWIHRVTGLLLSVMTVFHLIWVTWAVGSRRARPSMIFTLHDFTDAVENLRYYLGRRETPPRFGRFDYRQKFEYWGLIYGGLIMVLSGLILYFPIFFSRWMPAELIPAAKVMHSNEALLAFLIIIIWHTWGAHFSPEVFPIDTSIFTGKISKERLEHEHPLEYEEKFGKT